MKLNRDYYDSGCWKRFYLAVVGKKIERGITESTNRTNKQCKY